MQAGQSDQAEQRFAARARLAGDLLEMRAAREVHFPNAFFDEQGWNLLLILYPLHREARAPSRQVLLDEAGEPRSTAERWLQALIANHQVIERAPDAFVMSTWAVSAMEAFLDQTELLLQRTP